VGIHEIYGNIFIFLNNKDNNKDKIKRNYYFYNSSYLLFIHFGTCFSVLKIKHTIILFTPYEGVLYKFNLTLWARQTNNRLLAPPLT